MFTPSSELAGFEFPQDPVPAHHQTLVPLGTIPVPFPDPFSDGTGELTALSLADVSASTSDTSVDVTLTLAGNVHIHAPWDVPEFDVVLDAVALKVMLRTGFDPGTTSGTNPGVIDVVVDVQRHVDGCGIFGWCSGVVDALLPDLNGKIHDAILPALRAEIAKPEAKDAMVTLLDELSNGLTPVADGEPPWAVDLAFGVDIAAGAIHWQATHVLAPSAPQNCRSTELCTGAISFSCDPQVESFLLERFTSSSSTTEIVGGPNGTWSTVARDDNTTRGISPDLQDLSPP